MCRVWGSSRVPAVRTPPAPRPRDPALLMPASLASSLWRKEFECEAVRPRVQDPAVTWGRGRSLGEPSLCRLGSGQDAGLSEGQRGAGSAPAAAGQSQRD